MEKRPPARFGLPVRQRKPEELIQQDLVCFLGHNTVWVHIGGRRLLFDPIFGPIGGVIRRRTPVPLPVEEIPPPHLVFYSHAHRDHLDLPSLRALSGTPQVVVPLGAGRYLASNTFWELDWLEEKTLEGLRCLCLPVQHWSQRGLFDHNTSLWAAYLVEIEGFRIFFGGDTGYFEGFREIGERYGPFDLALLPCGAYEPRELMAAFHLSPEEAVQAALDLRARLAIPIHWGVYPLGDEAPEDPPRRFLEEARRRGLSARVLYPGECLFL